MSNKKEIWFTDLLHQHAYQRGIPLGIGYVGAYAKKIFEDNFSFKLFRDPNQFSAACHTTAPQIVGMSYNVGNERLSDAFITRCKKLHPETIVVVGGPHCPSVLEYKEEFLKKRPYVDFLVYGDGEYPFVELVKQLIAVDFDISKIKQSKPVIDSCYYLSHDGLILGGTSPRPALNELPSPYLTGLMDSFLKEGLRPIIQFTRGCPFTCTYCQEGLEYYSHIRRFSVEQFAAELEYIKALTPCDSLFIADVNFGIYRDDLEVARIIGEFQKKTGWPRMIAGFAGKGQNSRVVETFQQFAPKSFWYNLSLQSTDVTVLKNIKRQNISVDKMLKMNRAFNTLAYSSFTDIILGLPGDSVDSHLRSIQRVIEAGARHIG